MNPCQLPAKTVTLIIPRAHYLESDSPRVSTQYSKSLVKGQGEKRGFETVQLALLIDPDNSGWVTAIVRTRSSVLSKLLLVIKFQMHAINQISATKAHLRHLRPFSRNSLDGDGDKNEV